MISPETATDVSVECPGFMRLVILLGLPFILLVAGVLASVVLSVSFMPARAQATLGIQTLAGTYIMFPLLIVLFLWAVWSMFRYREGLFTAFRLGEPGIIIQNSRYGVLILHWDDVTATYSAPAKLIVLRSAKLEKPLAIMKFGQFVAAREMIRTRIGDRWSERWFV